MSDELLSLARKYIEQKVVGETSFDDCVHIATATINKVDVLVQLENPQPSRIVLIEELELNLSPRCQKKLLQFLKTLMPRLFAHQFHFSSHSPYFTQKDAEIVDIIHHVRIDYYVAGGRTSAENHNYCHP